jgi:hypothetical protein
MNNCVINDLSCKTNIPKHVIFKHIVPYTYTTQSNNLLRDIRNYNKDINLIESIYLTQYNEFILLVDLYLFHNYTLNMRYLPQKLETTFKRHFMLKDKTPHELRLYMVMNNLPHKRRRNTKFIWGLMTPEERNTFINSYILNED